LGTGIFIGGRIGGAGDRKERKAEEGEEFQSVKEDFL
jgi:hypothetical protein